MPAFVPYTDSRSQHSTTSSAHLLNLHHEFLSLSASDSIDIGSPYIDFEGLNLMIMTECFTSLPMDLSTQTGVNSILQIPAEQIAGEDDDQWISIVIGETLCDLFHRIDR
jgi:hypothetical protein